MDSYYGNRATWLWLWLWSLRPYLPCLCTTLPICAPEKTQAPVAAPPLTFSVPVVVPWGQ